MCKYCDTKNSFGDSAYSMVSRDSLNIHISRMTHCEYFMVVGIYDELKNIKGQYSNSPSKGYQQRIYYCPMCGRSLTDE